MKKNLIKAIIPMMLSLAISTPAMAYDTAAPFNDTILINQTDESDTAEYYTFEGIINNVYVRETTVSITVEAENDEVYIYHIYENTPVFDQKTMELVKNTELMEGKEVYVAYSYNTPMALSYPAQINPEVVIIKDRETASSVKVDKFDKDGLSSDKELKLNLSEDTNIVNLNGEKFDYKELGESALVVFYSVTTRSIPPQTPPQKVVVLDNKKEDTKQPEPTKPTEPNNTVKAEEFIAALPKEQLVEKNGIQYVRLRDAAEAFGFEVSWNDSTRTATLTKDAVSYTITIDETMYGYNRAVNYFTNPPFILNNRLFVESGFVSTILK